MILITGATGQVGTALSRLLPDAATATRSDLDLSERAAIDPYLDAVKPDTIINCAAYTAVDGAEQDEATAFAVNADAVERMARWARRHQARFITYSTDYVFAGDASTPYTEASPPAPAGTYGRSKLAGERAALAEYPATLVIRTSWVISGTHRNFVATMLRLAREGEVRVVDDQWGCPTVADDLAAATVRLLDASGIVHLTNQGPTTWCRLAAAAVRLAGMDPDLIVPATTAEVPRPAPRPAYSVLASERLGELGVDPLPHWQESLPAVVERLVANPPG